MRHIATRCTKCSCDTEVFCVSFAGQNKYLQETKFYSYFFASGYLQFTEMNFLWTFFQVDSFPPKAPIIPDIFTVAVETIYMKVHKYIYYESSIFLSHVFQFHKLFLLIHNFRNRNAKFGTFMWIAPRKLWCTRSTCQTRWENGTSGSTRKSCEISDQVCSHKIYPIITIFISKLLTSGQK